MKKKINKELKQSRQTKIFFGMMIASVLIITAGLIFSNIKVVQKRKLLLAKINGLKEEINYLQKKNDDLKEGVSQVEEDMYWETRLREQGYKKPGETVVVIKKPEAAAEKIDSQNLWQKFMSEVKGIF